MLSYPAVTQGKLQTVPRGLQVTRGRVGEAPLPTEGLKRTSFARMKELSALGDIHSDSAVASTVCCRCHHGDRRIYVAKVTMTVLALVLLVGYLLRRDEALMRETELIRSRLRAAGIWDLDPEGTADDHLDTSVSDSLTAPAAGTGGVDLDPHGTSSQLNGQTAGGVRLRKAAMRPSRRKRRQASEKDSTAGGRARRQKKKRNRSADDKVKKLKKKVEKHSQELLSLTQKVNDWHENDKVLRAHFHAGVATKFVRMAHEQNDTITTFEGEVTKDGFKPFDKKYKFWEEETERDQGAFHFDPNEGEVTIKHNGTYLIYTQIVYHDQSGRNSYGVYLTDREDPLAQCLLYEVRGNKTALSHEDRLGTHNYFQQCNTNTVRELTAGNVLYLQAIYENRVISPKHALSFWGLVKL